MVQDARQALVREDLALLCEVLEQRDPALLSETRGAPRLDGDRTERLRRAIVDELCETPGDAKRALALEELLIRLSRS